MVQLLSSPEAIFATRNCTAVSEPNTKAALRQGLQLGALDVDCPSRHVRTR